MFDINNIPDAKEVNGSELIVGLQDDNLVRFPVKLSTTGKKEYAATLTQTGILAPVATVLQNSFLTEIVWTYQAANTYRATLTGAFPALKTILPANMTRISDDVVELVQAAMTDYPVFFSVYFLIITDNPTAFTATDIDEQEIDLTWTSAADSFQLERSLDQNTWLQIYTDATASFNDTGLEESTTYYYRLKAITAGQQDSLWVYANATTIAAP